MLDAPGGSSYTRTRYGIPELLVLAAFSGFYFTAVVIRASAKFFWFDELCTLYICRLPTFGQSWQAVLHGADYNPPLFYLIERATRAVLGEGLVAMRVPSIFGVWAFCLSMFAVVTKRTGLTGGVIALLFPLCTLAGYYACEARPHAIVLGFCGLAIFCWEERGAIWRILFAFSLLAAFLTHCYAVLIIFPFLVAEICRSLAARRLRWSVWAAMLIPVLIAFLSYLPLLRAYKTTLADTGFAYMFRPGFWQVHFFYLSLFAPFIGVIACGLLLLATGSARRFQPSIEVVVYVAFALLPFAAVLFATAIQGPFIVRYYLATVAGFAILIGLAFGAPADRRWSALAFIVILCFGLGRDFAGLITHRIAGTAETMEEPVIHIPMNTTLGRPLADFQMLSQTESHLPIVLAEPMDFLYLVHYDQPLVPRLYYAAWSPGETNYRLYNSVRDWCHVQFNAPVTYQSFLAGHRSFYLFGDGATLLRLSELSKSGAKVNHFEMNEHHWLALLTY